MAMAATVNLDNQSKRRGELKQVTVNDQEKIKQGVLINKKLPKRLIRP